MPDGILLTCRFIYAEIKSLLCTEYCIIVPHEHIDHGLRFLRQLSPRVCARLTNLVVRLHVEGPAPLLHCSTPRSGPLQRGRIAAWEAAATHILSHAPPRTLTLHLVCDTGDGDETAAVLQPLVDRPGILKDIELRLHPGRYTHISSLAQYEAARIKGLDPSLRSKPFRFYALPPELRRAVLHYTDLVTPYNQVQWSPIHGFHFWEQPADCLGDDYCEEYWHRGCKFRFCKQDRMPGIAESFCRNSHSGYSS